MRFATVFACLLMLPALLHAQGGATPAGKKAAGPGVTVASLSRLDIVNTLEAGSCVQKQVVGIGIPCTGGGGANSWGESCVVNHLTGGLDDKETACVKSCPANFSNAIDCKLKACVASMAGKVYFRTFASLSDAVKTRIAGDYDTLIKLAQADGTPQYTTLGGDKKRSAVKRDILGEVVAGLIDDESQDHIGPGEMLPFGTCALQEAAQREHIMGEEVYLYKKYGKAPEVATGNASDASPMDTTEVGNLNVYESAFYECKKASKDLSKCESGLTAVAPDILAAEVVHELVHYTQNKYGHESEAGGLTNATTATKSLLNEIMAYEESKNDLFYRVALTPQDRAEVVDAGLKAQVNSFATVWPSLDKSTQQNVAQWAFGINWMKRRMVFPNTEPQDAKVWMSLCVALKSKMAFAPCGL